MINQPHCFYCLAIAIALLVGSCDRTYPSSVNSASPEGNITSPTSTPPAQDPPSPVPASGMQTSEEQTIAQQPACANPQTQAEMNACASSLAQAADQELNQVYQQVREHYKNSAQEELLIDAQLAWIKFRDANCKFSSSRFAGGSMAPLDYSSCIKRMTQERTEEIKQYLSGVE